MKKFISQITSFLSYHNAVPVMVSILFVGGASAFAATTSGALPLLIPTPIEGEVQEVVAASGIDFASVDLGAFTPSAQVTGVTEDTDTYYVTFEFSTIAPEDGLWHYSATTEVLTVSKTVLGANRDLGLYVAEQLKERITQEREYLARAQTIEKKNAAYAAASSLYSRLIGVSVDSSADGLEGYTPVVAPATPRVEPDAPYVASAQPSTPVAPSTPPAASSESASDASATASSTPSAATSETATSTEPVAETQTNTTETTEPVADALEKEVGAETQTDTTETENTEASENSADPAAPPIEEPASE